LQAGIPTAHHSKATTQAAIAESRPEGGRQRQSRHLT
jgi:hypothetical protein